jgi:hypothetical protein
MALDTLSQILAAGGTTNIKRHGAQRLLDDADNNIGNGVFLSPGTQSPTTFEQQNPPRIISLDALSPTGQMVTVALAARYSLDHNPSALVTNGGGGPIVAILEFGNGNSAMRVEVDVPIGRILVGANGLAIQEGQDGITMVTVPGGTLRVFMRDDSQLIPTTIGGQVSGSFQGIQLSGNIGNAPRVTFVQAAVDYFTRFSTKPPTRTIVVYTIAAAAPPQAFTNPAFVQALYNLPPFARTVRLLRSPFITANAVIEFWSVSSSSTPRLIDMATVGANVTSPIIEVPTGATWFNMYSANLVTFLAAEFGLGL